MFTKLFTLSLLLKTISFCTIPSLLGNWSGNLSQKSSMYSYLLSIKIEKEDRGILSGHIRYDWKGDNFIVYAFSGNMFANDSIVFNTVENPESSSLTIKEAVNFLPIKLIGKFLPRANGFTIQGIWANSKGIEDTANSYLELGLCRLGTFNVRKNQSISEMCSDYISSHKSSWEKKKYNETDVTYYKRQERESAELLDSFATDFYKAYFRLQGAKINYDTSSSKIQLTIEGCDPFYMPMNLDDVECFKKVYNSGLLEKKLKVHWNSVTTKSTIICFQLIIKKEFLCATSKSKADKLYQYGDCREK